MIHAKTGSHARRLSAATLDPLLSHEDHLCWGFHNTEWSLQMQSSDPDARVFHLISLTPRILKFYLFNYPFHTSGHIFFACTYSLQTFHVAPNLKLDFGKNNFICVQVHLIPCVTPCSLGVTRLNLLLQPSKWGSSKFARVSFCNH